MPRWLLWTLVALVSWGVWAVVSKLIGDALSAAQSQALSTLGLLPIIAALAFARKPSGSRSPRRGILCGFAAGARAGFGEGPHSPPRWPPRPSAHGPTPARPV